MRRYSPPRCGVDFPRDAFLLASRRGCSALPRKQGHKLCTDRYYNLNCAILRASTSPILRGGRKIQISRRYFFARHPCSCNRKIAIERASPAANISRLFCKAKSEGNLRNDEDRSIERNENTENAVPRQFAFRFCHRRTDA